MPGFLLRIALCWLLWLGAALPPAASAPPAAPATDRVPPSVMLAGRYGGQAVADYWVSEKLDGLRGRWDGTHLYTRAGHRIATPPWFTEHWPQVPMDGELWMGRGRFDEVSALARTGDRSSRRWTGVRFMVFDLPRHRGTFGQRVQHMRVLTRHAKVPWLQPVTQFRLDSNAQLEEHLRRIMAAGGEGLMLHHDQALYRSGRRDQLLKLKTHDDAEAKVVAHAPGKGKYAGMVGALVVEQADGRRFRLGSGLSDAERATPPPIGALVTYRYNGLTSTGLPRFARFMRVRHEQVPPDPR